MAGEEQTDSAGKYSMRGGPSGATKYWPTILKIVELILAILCIGLIDEPANNSRGRVFVNQRTVGICYSTFGTFLIFSAIYIIGKCIKDNWPWKTSALISLVGSILYLACCAMILKDWSTTKERNYWPPNTMRLDLQCSCGFIALIACITYIIDAILTVRAGVRGKFDEE